VVRGLYKFTQHLVGLEDCFILIGGTACELWMGSQGLDFRATKDLDIVLVVEALNPEFFERFWTFIRAGAYRSHEQSVTRPNFYRFTNPQDQAYPVMIELLTHNVLDLPADVHLTPIPVKDDVSSLSAILLDEAYYKYVIESRIIIDEVPTIPAHCLIPLKARAYLDLSTRKQAGDTTINERHIKKHRNDVFRLYQTLVPADRYSLPEPLQTDLQEFLDKLPPDSPDWSAIRNAVGGNALPTPDEIIRQLNEIFCLSIENSEERTQ
jgi:hypothetical protein